jgi:1-acyl-sn-glycerol-3-phosphate acyltransferase
MAYNQFELLRQRRFLPFFVVQSLGAFNDNVYRQAIIGLLASIGLSASEQSLYTNLAPALFILPFFLFSATAGQIAEKLEKSRLIRITTTMEIVIMSVAAVGFLLQNMPLLLVALFGTGLQAALFGPVKYSILPSVLKPEELTGGNGLVEMGTSISILIGMFAGGLIFEVAGRYGTETAAAAIVALAITGNLVSRLIPPVDAGMPDLKVNINPIPESRRVLALAKKQLAVRNSMLGVSWFWFFGTMLTAQMLTYAQVNLGGTPSLYLMPLALFSIGTGIGSLLCEKLSARTVEIGLVPLGAFGMSAFLLDLYFARPDVAGVAGLSLAEFVRAPGSVRIMIDFTGIGLFAGIFIVPLFALIQSRTPKQEISRVISAVNIQNAMFIVLAAVAGIALQMEQFKVGDTVVPMLGLSIPQLFLCLAIANTVVAIWIFTIVPEFLMRFLSWVLVRALYRLELHGIEKHVPDEGPALIVCNHVTYMDALILSASIPRPVRFVMYYKIFNIPVMRWIFRTGKAIPIAGAKEDPEIMRRAFDAVDAALAAGEIVCIFPEGALTRDGNIAPFKGGVEKILERRPVPVVPMALRSMWTSMWSKRDGRLARMRVPRRFRAHIEVMAGEPVPGREASAAGLEARVRALRGDAA